MRNSKVLPLEVIRWACVVLMILLLVHLAGGNRQSKTTFDAMSKVIENQASGMSDVKKGDNQMIRRLYGLDPDAYDGVLLYYPSSNMGPEEILLVRLKTMDQQKTVSDACDARRSTQMKNFNGYAPKEYGIVEKSVTDVKGNYVLYVSAEKTEPVIQAFEKAL